MTAWIGVVVKSRKGNAVGISHKIKDLIQAMKAIEINRLTSQ